MIIASVNGMSGQGFVEVIEGSDGSVRRAGLIKLSAPNAMRLQGLFDTHEPLIYNGPVLSNGRWRAESFAVVATSVVMEPGAPPTLSVTLDSPAVAVAT
jgi:hypothetical protein